MHVHALGTTGLHPRERRCHVHGDRCAQCKKCLDGDHVAAHVVSYPCFPCNCCAGTLQLVSTCRACNAKNQLGKARVDGDSCFVDACPPERPALACVCWPRWLH